MLLAGWEIPRNYCSRIFDSVIFKRGAESNRYCGNVAVTAHFSDEATFWLERAAYTLNHRIGIAFHPVQGGIGEDSIEFCLEIELIGINNPRVNISSLGCSDHIGGGIHSNDVSAFGNYFFCERAITAAEIEDALARLWIQQVEDRLP